LLKPPLARGELQCIAATTLDEHRMHFDKDKALARRFQPVFVDEPSQEDSVEILLGLRENYEIYHKCKFTLEAINAAVYLSARYIPDRQLPDKAIDLIDEAGSRARIETFQKRKEGQSSVLLKAPDEYWQEIKAVQAMHEVVDILQWLYCGKKKIHLIIFNILMSFIAQVLSNKMKYSPNENDQHSDNGNNEAPNQDKAGSASTSPVSIEE
jgi:ATP-dependent Clp protease ATP-binding subunit ClpC